MSIKNTIKKGIHLTADTAADIAQTAAQKNRLRANANRLKQIMKGDNDTRNQAYIELGRYYYDNMRDKDNEENEALCVIIDKTSARIEKASKRYVEFLSEQDNTKFDLFDSNEVKQAVIKTAERAKQAASEKAKELKDKAKQSSDDLKEKAKITAEKTAKDIKEKSEVAAEKAKEKAADAAQRAKVAATAFTLKARERADELKEKMDYSSDLDEFVESESKESAQPQSEPQATLEQPNTVPDTEKKTDVSFEPAKSQEVNAPQSDENESRTFHTAAQNIPAAPTNPSSEEAAENFEF